MAVSPSKRKSVGHEVQTPKKKAANAKPKTPKSTKKNAEKAEKVVEDVEMKEEVEEAETSTKPQTPKSPKSPKMQKKTSPKKKKNATAFPGTIDNKEFRTPTIEEIEKVVDEEFGEITEKTRYVLFIGNLHYKAMSWEIRKHFEQFTSVKTVRIPKLTGKVKLPLGYGYLEVPDKESYIKALTLNHTIFKDRRISVLFTKPGPKCTEEEKTSIYHKNVKLNKLWNVKPYSKSAPEKLAEKKAAAKKPAAKKPAAAAKKPAVKKEEKVEAESEDDDEDEADSDSDSE